MSCECNSAVQVMLWSCQAKSIQLICTEDSNWRTKANSFFMLQRLAQQAGLRGLSVYIVNFDMPLQDIHAGRVPAVPSHLTTLLQASEAQYICLIPLHSMHAVCFSCMPHERRQSQES